VNRRLLLSLGFLLGAAASIRSGPPTINLRYTYRPEQASVTPLRGEGGKIWIPLLDVANFYGAAVDYQPATGRVALTRAGRKAVFVLSQPYALVEGTESIFLPPAEMVQGQLAVEPEAAADLLRALMNVRATYFDDLGSIAVGGVDPEDLRREIEGGETGPVIPTTPGPLAIPTPAGTPSPEPTLPPEIQRVQTIHLNRTRIYQVRRIVIDPGHGGKDGGARGYSKKFWEKQATLAIALKVVELLKREPDLEVLMTRDRDKYITLKYRTDFANRHKADLFVSIHCNANLKHTAKGTETYVYSSKATGNEAALLERENIEGDFMDFTFADMNHNKYRERSYFLAQEVDKRIQQRLGQKILRIEQAPFYVLARVNMPSILVETAFITHKDEEKKLEDPAWRDQIAQAIADGILAYRDRIEELADMRAKAKP